MRPTLLLALAATLAFLPTARADDVAYVAWIPGDIVLEDVDEYYLKATASVPELPHEESAEGADCAYADRPGVAVEGATRLVDRLDNAADDPTPLSNWFPTCAAVNAWGLAYASYDVGEGRYYLESRYLEAGAPGGASRGLDSTNESGLTGTTGMGLEADCVACPQPP